MPSENPMLRPLLKDVKDIHDSVLDIAGKLFDLSDKFEAAEVSLELKAKRGAADASAQHLEDVLDQLGFALATEIANTEVPY